jgi:hypothetical protein
MRRVVFGVLGRLVGAVVGVLVLALAWASPVLRRLAIPVSFALNVDPSGNVVSPRDRAAKGSVTRAGNRAASANAGKSKSAVTRAANKARAGQEARNAERATARAAAERKAKRGARGARTPGARTR